MRTLIFALVFVCPPCLKGPVLRWCWGASIGRRVRIGWFSTVLGRHVELGDYSEVRSFTIMRCDGDVRIGAYRCLDRDA